MFPLHGKKKGMTTRNPFLTPEDQDSPLMAPPSPESEGEGEGEGDAWDVEFEGKGEEIPPETTVEVGAIPLAVAIPETLPTEAKMAPLVPLPLPAALPPPLPTLPAAPVWGFSRSAESSPLSRRHFAVSMPSTPDRYGFSYWPQASFLEQTHWPEAKSRERSRSLEDDEDY